MYIFFSKDSEFLIHILTSTVAAAAALASAGVAKHELEKDWTSDEESDPQEKYAGQPSPDSGTGVFLGLDSDALF